MVDIKNKNNLLNSIGVKIKKPKRVKYTEAEKLEKRKEYMKRYYQKKKLKRIAEFGKKSVRQYIKKAEKQKFTIRQGNFVIKFQ